MKKRPVSLLQTTQNTRDLGGYFREKYGDTPISNASKNGHIEIVRYLYEECNAKVRMNLLEYAADNGHCDIVKYLWEKFNKEHN